MNKITKGNVVKFIGADGLLNGGTVVDFFRKNNEEFVLINTLDGKKISKNINDVHPIKRQQRGRISAKFIDELKEEIRLENANPQTEEMLAHQVAATSEEPEREETIVPVESKESEVVSRLRGLLKDNDLIIKTRDAEIYELRRHIKDLEDKLEHFNVPHLLLAVQGLGDALLAASINKEGDMVQELLKIINKLTGVTK